MSQISCFCGCETFRFKLNEETKKVDVDPQTLFYNICRNCNHAFSDHLKILRSKQAD